MTRKALCWAAVVVGLVSASGTARGTIIVENTGGNSTNAALVFGQLFTTPAGGAFNNITFNFFSDFSATTPAAFGTGFLLSQQYLGTPSALGSSTPGFLGQSTSISGGIYTFAPSLTLLPGTTYYLYENVIIPKGSITGGNVFPGGHDYFTSSLGDNFEVGTLSPNFRVSGTSVSAVPEPNSLLGAGTGVLLGLAFARRRQARATA